MCPEHPRVTEYGQDFCESWQRQDLYSSYRSDLHITAAKDTSFSIWFYYSGTKPNLRQQFCAGLLNNYNYLILFPLFPFIY